MALTLRAVLDELDRLQGANEERTIDEIGREEIVQSVARAALLGARGNSGVILSQLIRGAAEELVSRPGQLIDAPLIGAALAKAADRAYSSVRDPAEGTILTVAREMAHKIVTDVAHSPEDPRLDPDDAPARAGRRDRRGARARGRGRRRTRSSAARSCLRALREAGVVDAGGYGLTIIFAGVVAALRGDEPPRARPSCAGADHPPRARVEHLPLLHELRRHRHRARAPGRFIGPLERIGDSVLVVGDETTLKVHVHTDEPELATAVFARRRRGLAAGCRRHAPAGRRARTRADRRSADERAGAREDGAAGARRDRCGRRGIARSCSTSSACTRSTAARR